MKVSISSFMIDWLSDLCWWLESIAFGFFLGMINCYVYVEKSY